MLLKHGVRSIPADTENQTLAELNLALSLNLRCAIQCMQALLPSMKDAGFGRIVNMPSRAALGKELRLAYKETAAGLIGNAYLDSEIEKFGITFHAIARDRLKQNCFKK